jgi:hypothetical protein
MGDPQTMKNTIKLAIGILAVTFVVVLFITAPYLKKTQAATVLANQTNREQVAHQDNLKKSLMMNAMASVKLIKEELRDPDSFTVYSVIMVHNVCPENTSPEVCKSMPGLEWAPCIDFGARNGFGGMNRRRTSSGFIGDGSDLADAMIAKDWKRDCSNPEQQDLTDDVKKELTTLH